jgi:hypothetical protein
MNEYLSEYKRKVKSLSENIYLEGVIIEFAHVTQFLIYSATKKHYCISIKPCKDKLKIACDCPDFQRRKMYCKHIYWLGIKQFNKENPATWMNEDIDTYLKNYYSLYGYSHWTYPEGILYGNNDICPICLDKIDYNNEFTLCCKKGCNNSVHVMCWNNYQDVSQSYKCVLCRKQLF